MLSEKMCKRLQFIADYKRRSGDVPPLPGVWSNATDRALLKRGLIEPVTVTQKLGGAEQ